MVQAATPRPKYVQNIVLAYVVGGAICVIGQLVLNLLGKMQFGKLEASAATLATIIALGSITTGLGVYDWLAERAGMGAAVPISGFSNTITAAAMDFKREGYILGMGAKMFVIAGPVLVYGILSGFIVALLRLIVTGMLS
ncbi:MAG: SpoVA/SpoVAEb family sporulation membrane protein [Firmicutes bacterium]|nr:SpoVA/SpoVAEb family sporulation membrane protein [Bacillota bacterium]